MYLSFSSQFSLAKPSHMAFTFSSCSLISWSLLANGKKCQQMSYYKYKLQCLKLLSLQLSIFLVSLGNENLSFFHFHRYLIRFLSQFLQGHLVMLHETLEHICGACRIRFRGVDLYYNGPIHFAFSGLRRGLRVFTQILLGTCLYRRHVYGTVRWRYIYAPF